ncbi:hypothetical protein RFI_36871, partial [Reticulomyxa filosa]
MLLNLGQHINETHIIQFFEKAVHSRQINITLPLKDIYLFQSQTFVTPGHCIVELHSHEDALQCVDKLNYQILFVYPFRSVVVELAKPKPQKTGSFETNDEQISADASASSLTLALKGKTRRLFVSNLHWSVTNDTLQQHFAGSQNQNNDDNDDNNRIQNFFIHKTKQGFSKGFAFLTFFTVQDAADAFQNFNHTDLLGRKIQ